jgi:hypothetical protein
LTSEEPTNPKCLRLLFWVGFWTFLGKGVQIHHGHIFTKVHVKLSPRNNSSAFFGFIAFSGVSQRWESKALQKTFCQAIASKSFYKRTEKKSEADIFSVLLDRVFGRSSVRGFQKHGKKYRPKT